MAGPWEKFSPGNFAPEGPWSKFTPEAAAPKPEPYNAGARVAFGQGFLEGAPIIGPAMTGLADRVGAGIASLITGDTYANELEKGRARAKDTKEANPTINAIGELAGGMTVMAPAVATAPRVFGAGSGPLTLGKIAAGAGSGAAIGGTDAAIRSGGDKSDTVIGTALGGAMGAAAPVAGVALSRAGHAIADSLAQRTALRDLGVSRPAADVLTRAAESDNALAGSGLQNIRSAGPDAMLADAGLAMQNVLDTAVQRGGPNAAVAKGAIETRAAEAGKRLDDALDMAFGKARGVNTATTEIRQGSAPARSAAYKAAYDSPIDYASAPGMEIEALIKNHVPQSAIEKANALIRADRDAGPSRQILAKIADDGSVIYERLPDVRQIDYITRALNDVAVNQEGGGLLAGQTNLGRVYKDLSRTLRDNLKMAVPEYGIALETAAGPIQARQALEFGTEILRPNVPRDVVLDTVRGMTGPEKANVRQGLRSAIDEAFANVKRTITDPNVDARQAMEIVKQFSSPAVQEKIGLLLKDKELEALNTAIDQATRALSLRAAMATNSKTAARTMTKEAIDDATAPTMTEQFMAGRPIKGVQEISQFLTRTRPSDVTRKQDAVYGELAGILTEPRGALAEQYMQMISDAYNRRANASSVANRIPYGTIVSIGALGSLPLLNQGKD